MGVDTSRANLLQLWKKLQQSCPSMQSACIILYHAWSCRVTTLELTKQIQQLPAQQRVPEICVLSGTVRAHRKTLAPCWHRKCLEWAMLRTIPWGSCSSKLWHSETHSETCFIFSRTMQVCCLRLRKHLGKNLAQVKVVRLIPYEV